MAGSASRGLRRPHCRRRCGAHAWGEPGLRQTEGTAVPVQAQAQLEPGGAVWLAARLGPRERPHRGAHRRLEAPCLRVRRREQIEIARVLEAALRGQLLGDPDRLDRVALARVGMGSAGPAQEPPQPGSRLERLGVSRRDRDRALDLLERGRRLPLQRQCERQGVVRLRVGPRVGKRVREERARISPRLHVGVRDEGARTEYHGGDRAEQRASRGHAREQGRGREADREEEPDERQVGVAIRQRLVPDLDQAQRGYQRPQEEEPADGEPGHAAAREEREPSYDEEERRRAGHPEERPASRVRIEDGEVRGPEGLSQVARVGDRGVREPRVQGKLPERPRRPARALRQRRDRGGRCAEHEVGDFLGQQHARPPQPTAQLGAPERPVVEQQHHEGQGHRHRLGHQGERGERDREDERSASAPPRPAAVRPQRKQEEERRQQVLALGDPGHRLHVQRM
jgi:hypothetical protein